MVHVVGSNNGLQPWTGIGLASPLVPQVREEQARMANSIAVVRSSFAQARTSHDRAVVVMMQADMFDPTYTPAPEDISAFRPLVQALADEAQSYSGQVYLVNGDSHVYHSDQPLVGIAVAGHVRRHGLGRHPPAHHGRRVEHNKDWLKVTIDRPGSTWVLSWSRVPYTS